VNLQQWYRISKSDIQQPDEPLEGAAKVDDPSQAYAAIAAADTLPS